MDKLTLYQRRLLIEVDGKGYITVHRHNPNQWQRRRALLKMVQLGVLVVCTPIIGSYMTLVKNKRTEGFNPNEFPK